MVPRQSKLPKNELLFVCFIPFIVLFSIKLKHQSLFMHEECNIIQSGLMNIHYKKQNSVDLFLQGYWSPTREYQLTRLWRFVVPRQCFKTEGFEK